MPKLTWVASVSFPMVCWMISSILAATRSDSSIRVPTGNCTMKRNWLSSMEGKNSLPMKK